MTLRQAACRGMDKISGRQTGNSSLHRTVPDREFRPVGGSTAAGCFCARPAGHQTEREWGAQTICQVACEALPPWPSAATTVLQNM